MPNALRSTSGAVAALAVFMMGAVATARGETALSGLAGSWSGGGQIRLADGRSERLSCRASYNPRDGGNGLGMSIRCASQSYKIELRSSLVLAGGRVSGSWEERSFNAGGAVSGTSATGALRLSFSGTMGGSISVSYGGSSQQVSIKTSGSELSSISLNMKRD